MGAVCLLGNGDVGGGMVCGEGGGRGGGGVMHKWLVNKFQSCMCCLCEWKGGCII